MGAALESSTDSNNQFKRQETQAEYNRRISRLDNENRFQAELDKLDIDRESFEVLRQSETSPKKDKTPENVVKEEEDEGEDSLSPSDEEKDKAAEDKPKDETTKEEPSKQDDEDG